MVLRDDAMLVPCDTSMGNVGKQPMWSSARPQYKDSCHCKNWLATL